MRRPGHRRGVLILGVELGVSNPKCLATRLFHWAVRIPVSPPFHIPLNSARRQNIPIRRTFPRENHKYCSGGVSLIPPEATHVWGYFWGYRAFSAGGIVQKLSEAKIRAAKPKEKAWKLPDGGGLFLFISPNGSKLWRWKYRHERREKLMSFGSYPEVSLATAREMHAAARKTLATGVDPMEAKREENIPAGQSFEEIAREWHKHWSVGKTERHTEGTWSRIEANIMPSLGSKRATLVTTKDVVATVVSIQDRGVYDLAKRCLGSIGQIYRYAIVHGKAETNPAAAIKPRDILKSVRKQNYARIDAKHLGKLMRDIESYRGQPVTRLAIKLMANIFLRTTELIEGRWSEVDFSGHRWDIPAERMKMRTPHVVPLSRQSLLILRMLHDITGNSGKIFPGDTDTGFMSNNTILKALARMGYQYDMTGHGFRGLASTVLHEEGFEHEHIELQLAHMPRNAVSASYNHAKYLKQRVKMMQWWSDHLEEEMGRWED